MKDLHDRIFSFFFPIEAELRAISYMALQAGNHVRGARRVAQKFWVNKTLCNLIVENQMLSILFEARVQGDYTKESEYLDVRTRYVAAQSSIHQFAVEYAKVLDVLTKKNITFLVMKALPRLASSGSFFHKELNDIDILVPVPDFYKAARVMRDLKYLRLDHREGKILKDQTVYERFYPPKQEEFFYKHPFSVEIHMCFPQTEGFANRVYDAESARDLTRELFAHKEKKYFCGSDVYILEKNYLLISLIVHAFFNHNFQSFILFYEIALLIHQTDTAVNWNYCLKYFKDKSIVTYYYWFLCFFDWLFPDMLPIRVRRLLVGYQKTWNFIQKILFFTMKYLLFHPKTHTNSEAFKKAAWAIMDKRIIDSFRRNLLRKESGV